MSTLTDCTQTHRSGPPQTTSKNTIYLKSSQHVYMYSMVHYTHSQIHIWKQKWFKPILFDFKPTMTMHHLILLEMSEFIKRYMDGLSHVYSDVHLYIQTLMVGHHYDTSTCTCRRHCAHVVIKTWPSTHFSTDKSDSVNSCDYTSTC